MQTTDQLRCQASCSRRALHRGGSVIIETHSSSAVNAASSGWYHELKNMILGVAVGMIVHSALPLRVQRLQYSEILQWIVGSGYTRGHRVTRGCAALALGAAVFYAATAVTRRAACTRKGMLRDGSETIVTNHSSEAGALLHTKHHNDERGVLCPHTYIRVTATENATVIISCHGGPTDHMQTRTLPEGGGELRAASVTRNDRRTLSIVASPGLVSHPCTCVACVSVHDYVIGWQRECMPM